MRTASSVVSGLVVAAIAAFAVACGGGESSTRDDGGQGAAQPVDALPAPERTVPPAPDDVDEDDLPPAKAPSEDDDWLQRPR